MSITALTPARHNCAHVPVSTNCDSEQSSAWTDYHDEWVERQAAAIVNDQERDLIDTIIGYCDTPYVSAVTGLKLDHWGDFDRALRAAIEESPCLRDFIEKAARLHAEKDFGEMVKGV